MANYFVADGAPTTGTGSIVLVAQGQFTIDLGPVAGINVGDVVKYGATYGVVQDIVGNEYQCGYDDRVYSVPSGSGSYSVYAKAALIAEGYLPEQCNRCEFGEARLLDGKVPLILTFKDKNKHNYHRDNIELLCYNCSFLYAASPISDEQVEQMEDYVELQVKNYDWEIDQAHIDHLKELGLWEDNKKPGDEFISRQ